MVELRDAILADAPGMAHVIVDTWFAAHRGQVDPAIFAEREANWGYADSEAGWRRTIAALSADDKILVATEQSAIVGVGASTLIDAATAEITILYVDVDHQGQGIGHHLANTIMAFYSARGVSTVHIAVLTANTPARRFYERIGGTVVGERQHDEGAETVYAWTLG